MKVLLLSCNTGGGHNAAAKAIAGYLESQGVEYEIKDSLKLVPTAKRDMVEKGHSALYKYAPDLYGAAYTISENQKSHTLLYLDYAKYSGTVATYIKRRKFDIAICVHEFPAMMLTAARKLKQLDIRQYFVATDYTCSPGVETLDMDAWFVPRELAAAFAEKGVPADRIVETGIPVARRFHEPLDRNEARCQLGLRDDLPLALIGAGSIGCGPISELALALKERGAGYVAVLCGNNKKLLRELALKSDDAFLIPVSFTSKVRTWMAAADVMITKPGGLSSTEAATARIPLVFMDAVPGLETHNRNFFLARGCGLAGDSVDELLETATGLLEDADKRERMIACQSAHFDSDSTQAIVDYVLAV